MSENADGHAPWVPRFENAVEWLSDRTRLPHPECEAIVRVLWTKAYAIPVQDRPDPKGSAPVFVAMGDAGVPFAAEQFLESVHRSREGAEAALAALGPDGRYGEVVESEVKP